MLTQAHISDSSNAAMLDKYVKLRILGHPPFMAAAGAEVPIEISEEYARLAELNDDFISMFKSGLDGLEDSCGWSRKVSIIRLMETVNDPYAKRSDKTNAIKELNMLVGITAIDDNGRTVIPSLKDFFAGE